MKIHSLAFKLARPFLHAMEAETAHDLTIKALTSGITGKKPNVPGLGITRFGLNFPNPLGLAAGFDKNAEVPHAMLGMGFGFVEVGTVTPHPQSGNPPPRMFRLGPDQAVINRLGFNNQGHAEVLKRLAAHRNRQGIIGVNIGANRDTADKTQDYIKGIKTFADVASYYAVNISSPNTPGLRDLQSAEQLRPLLEGLNEARSRLSRHVPMLLKISPDLEERELTAIALCCEGGAVDGVIVSNTTLSRPLLKSPSANETGGLSGAPLFDLSTRQLARFYLLTGGNIPLVGLGGISSAEQAWIKIRAGATLLQLYSALVYQGPGLIDEILSGLSARLRVDNVAIDQIIGADASRHAHQTPIGT